MRENKREQFLIKLKKNKQLVVKHKNISNLCLNNKTKQIQIKSK